MVIDVLDDLVEILTAEGVDSALIDRAILKARDQWGGMSNYIRRIDKRIRDARIQQALQQGCSVKSVAKTVGCGINTVKRKKSRWL